MGAQKGVYILAKQKDMMDGRKLGKASNVVHNDEIWKDQVQRGLLAQQVWSQKWGYICDVYKEIHPASKTTNDQQNTTETVTKEQKFPQTDAQMIGWKSAKSTRDAYGIPEARAKGRRDFYKTLHWPPGSQ